MKRFNLVVVLLALLTVFTVGQAFAYPIADGASVYLLQSTTGAYNGDFRVYEKQEDGTGPVLFNTFCVEKTVHFSPNVTYTATVDAAIMNTEEALHDGTKYLYWNFAQGTLSDFNNDKSSVDTLQAAFWMLQGDMDVDTGNSFYNLAIDTDNMALGAGYDVMVMNLWDGETAKQSQLIAGAPVPEPATLILLGSGLAGLALYRRKKK